MVIHKCDCCGQDTSRNDVQRYNHQKTTIIPCVEVSVPSEKQYTRRVGDLCRLCLHDLYEQIEVFMKTGRR